MKFPKPVARFVAMRAAAHDGKPMAESMCEQASFWEVEHARDWQTQPPFSGTDVSASVRIIIDRYTGHIFDVSAGMQPSKVQIGLDGKGNTVIRRLHDRSHDEPPLPPEVQPKRRP